ncbi:TetR/AcrR family transcriptional regulator [Colwellia sp. RSH04]|uniref:TetR/AcrR family transcriptional regulator n=1 Tax=Colwellia sp. RSH04 TaxID=2305464 RepID=UPI00217502C0|nr:TetR/AcrR family transcriptional regulator [Colwellia sp. RSH04]
MSNVCKLFLTAMTQDLRKLDTVATCKVLTTRGERILDAAQQLFFEHGYDETSLQMIINKTGGSRRSIYNEFGNKKGLLVAVIQRQVYFQTETLNAIDRSLSASDCLNDVCFRFVKGMCSPEIRSLFRLVVQQTVKHPELGEMIYQSGPIMGVKPLEDYLIELNEKRILVIDDCHFAARFLLEMAKGPLYTNLLLLPQKQASDEEIKEQINIAVKVFIKSHCA